MALHRPVADAQLQGDLPIGVAPGNPDEHLALAAGELRQCARGGLGRVSPNNRAQPPRDRRTEERLPPPRSEEHTSELQSRLHLVCRLLLEKKNTTQTNI